MSDLPTIRDVAALLRLRCDPVGVLERLRTAGDVVPIGGWPGKKYYFVNSPAAIKALLSHDSIEIARRGVLQEIFAGSWFIARGAEWAEKRAHVLPAYNVGGHAEYAARIDEGLGRAFERWDAAVGAGSLIDIGAEMLALALDVMVRMLFTVQFAPPPDVQHLFHDCMEWNRWRASKKRSAWFVPRNVQFRRAHSRLREIVRDLIEAQRREGSASFLTLMESARDRNGQPLNPYMIESEILNILSVGHVSSGSALTWTFYELMRHPAALAVLRDEASRATPSATAFQTQRTWSAQVVTEALRLHPPIWLFTRRCIEEVRFGDVVLPKGAVLLFCPRVLHRDLAYWSHPDDFDPARFQWTKWPPTLEQGYFPFGAGKRQCLGKGIATLVASLVVPAIAERYVMEPLDAAPAEAVPLTTLMPAKALLARWTRRAIMTPQLGATA